jgi:SAM-dependent methyltransferase
MALRWRSRDAAHTDRWFFEQLNFWRDFFPGDLGERLARAAPGEAVVVNAAAGELVEAHDRALVKSVRREQYRPRSAVLAALEPRVGRFYLRDFLHGVDDIYGGDKRPMRVLDLMSGWVSHLPPGVKELDVTGLGLNRDELEENRALRERAVHDLNTDPRLPFGDAAFDAVICTASVEYLIQPLEVFGEVRRVLKPGAPFITTFSDRWFPTKVIDLWIELHPFERMGLVLECFRRAGGFEGLATESVRGLPRPADDKYAAELPKSDPVFAVWGRRE